MRKTTTNEFIEKGNKKYNNFFDYSKVNYVDNKTKVCIICPKHGEFWQAPSNHLDSDKVYGCHECARLNYQSGRKLGNEGFINKAREKFGDLYDYSLVEYITNRDRVKIICPEHGIFEQSPSGHLKSEGCPKCQKERTKKHVPKKEAIALDINIISEPVLAKSGNVIGSVYLFRNINNNKVYIGKTIENYNYRFSKHNSCAFETNVQNYFYNAIRKYGWDNFDKYIIFQTEEYKKSKENKKLVDEIICKKEIEFIELFKSNLNEFGYNLTKGGDGVVGYKFTEEAKLKMRLRMSGENHPNFGKKGKSGKKIKQFDLSGNFIKEYISIKQAVEETNINQGMIIKCGKNNAPIAGGYIWIYSLDFNEDVLKSKILALQDTVNIRNPTEHRNGNNKIVFRYSLDGKFIKEYFSASEASKWLNCDSSLISGAASGKLNLAKNSIWIYKKDFSLELLKNKIENVKNKSCGILMN